MPNFKNIFKVVQPGAAEDAPPPATGGDVMSRIKADVDANPVLIYMKGTPEMPQCGFSAATIEVFNALGVNYATRNVLEDPELRQAIKEYSHWPTIPQVYVGGEFIGGCDIVTDLHARGELDQVVRQRLGE